MPHVLAGGDMNAELVGIVDNILPRAIQICRPNPAIDDARRNLLIGICKFAGEGVVAILWIPKPGSA